MCSLSVERLSFSKCIRKANGLGMTVKKQGSLTIIYQFGYLDRIEVGVIVPADRPELFYCILCDIRQQLVA